MAIAEEIENEVKVKVKTQKLAEGMPADVEPNIQDFPQVNSVLSLLGMAAELKNLPIFIEPYDIKEDFEWYASGQVDTRDFRGKYITIWKKQIVGVGDTAIEAERLAKANRGEECRPAVVFIPREPVATL